MSGRQIKRQRRKQREQEQQDIHQFLFETVGQLRRILGPELRCLRDMFPNHRLPCDTCAFRAATDDSEGQERTFLGLLATLVSGQTFYCHVDPETGEPFPPNERGDYSVEEAVQAGRAVNPCAGWMTLQSHPPEHYIGLVADVIAKGPVPRPVPEPLRSTIAVGLVNIWKDLESQARATRPASTTSTASAISSAPIPLPSSVSSRPAPEAPKLF